MGGTVSVNAHTSLTCEEYFEILRREHLKFRKITDVLRQSGRQYFI